MAHQNSTLAAALTGPGADNGAIANTTQRRALYLKLFSGDYNVEITSKGISKFSQTSANLKYFIATESDSTFGG